MSFDIPLEKTLIMSTFWIITVSALVSIIIIWSIWRCAIAFNEIKVILDDPIDEELQFSSHEHAGYHNFK